MKEFFDWEFKALNPVDYEANIVLIAKNKLFKTIFNNTKKLIRLKTGEKVNGEIEKIEEFDIPLKFHKLLLNITKNQLATIQKEISADRVKMISNNVYRAFFKNMGDHWVITIIYRGEYIKDA